jgi:hypothetical protein
MMGRWKRAKRITAAIVACFMLPALILWAGEAAANHLGVYKGAGSSGRANVPTFEAWLGRKVLRAADFVDYRGGWTNMVSSAVWLAHSWDGSRWRLTLSVPMLPWDGVSTLKEGATGAYNTYYRRIAATLIGHGHANAVIRLGWEFNGSWFPWAANKCPSCFIQYWRQIVTTMRSMPGAQFHFDWCPNIGYQAIAAEKAYPGDAYVDLIGMDVYNESWDPNITTPAARWNQLMNESHGLKWHATFAAAHHKWISFPEWGTGVRRRYPSIGGGDDPYFIQQMYNWMQWHSVGYHIYWDFQSDFKSQLSNNQYPNAGALFKRLFLPAP